MKAREKYTYDKVMQVYSSLLKERQDWDTCARDISANLLPGRGIFHHLTKPTKRHLTTDDVINTVGEDSLTVLTSGLHGRLTSPAMPWFKAEWADKRINDIPQAVQYLQESSDIVNALLQDSSFYSLIEPFYTEYFGYGNAAMFLGENTDDNESLFHFELMTWGEWAVAMGKDGKPSTMCRTIYKSDRQIVESFPDTATPEMKKRVKDKQAGIDVCDKALVELVCKEKYMDKRYFRTIYQVESYSSGSGTPGGTVNSQKKPLVIDGFYEWPYPLARCKVIGSDTYGLGPGHRALPDIKRLQEMEKSFLIATHKDIDPALNVPAKLRNKVSTLPGAKNYYSNPDNVITPIQNGAFNYQGVMAAVERVEERIQRNFYNDVFLTATRDPNASPLKAAQVHSQEQEKTFRLGPAVDSLMENYLEPMLRRCFNMAKRKNLLPEMSPELEEIVGDFKLDIISPMAVAQKAIKTQGTDSFMGFIASAAQFEPSVLDNIDVDLAARQRADINGVDIGILRDPEEVKSMRAAKAKQQQAQQEAQQQAAQAEQSQSLTSQQIADRKTLAETSNLLSDTQIASREAGLQ